MSELKSNPIKIPYAVSNYEKIVRENYYWIDNSKYIVELERYTAPVFLRPRRFGKTLLCSILECYYDINRKDQFNELFGHTVIGDHPTPERNTCLTMRFNFSEVKVSDDKTLLERNFNLICSAAFQEFISAYQNYFPEFLFPEVDASNQLKMILSLIKTNQLPPVYIIIDEYDNFTNQLIQSHQDDLYCYLTTGDSFFRTFFKVVKAGTEDLTVRRCYITGVLPITIDDLTSGFNIAEILTLKPNFITMLGFTQSEVDLYLERIFSDYGFDRNRLELIRSILKSYYNGYRFSTDSEELYNSTIITFFLKDFVLGNGQLPQEFIDDNIKTDTNWIRRLTGAVHIQDDANAKTMLETLLFDGEMEYDYNMLTSKFSMNQFFQSSFYPVSLFYLGMLTIRSRFRMTFPNQTLKKIFTDYFNEIEQLNVSIGYTKYFERFLNDLDITKLFAGYFEHYIGQIPAQACDKMNENFYRTTFYELCTRYLSHDFVFTIETNYPSGRSDWEMLGKYHTLFKNLKWVIEFKHFTQAQVRKQGIAKLKSARDQEARQVIGYAQDILTQFPEYQIRKYVIYTIACKSFRMFEV